MRSRIGMLATVLLMVVAAGGQAQAADCTVADPTGTPLNVRAEPKGRILSVLENGIAVQVTDETWAGGKRWVRVSADDGTRGWVFADYLDCVAMENLQKSAPMRPRMAPQ